MKLGAVGNFTLVLSNYLFSTVAYQYGGWTDL
jgi:hypothetical protein